MGISEVHFRSRYGDFGFDSRTPQCLDFDFGRRGSVEEHGSI